MADTLIQGTTIIEDKRTGIGEVWSVTGTAFHPVSADIQDVLRNGLKVRADENTVIFNAVVNLPHGAKVTSVITKGNISDETWSLLKVTLDGTTFVTMATGNLNSEDTSITDAIIDNLNFAYSLGTGTLDNTDEIWGAVIKFEV